MKATIPYIQEKFNEFNQQMFDGCLPMLPIKLSKARTFLGILAYRRRRTLSGEIEKYDFRLRISTYHDLPEQELEDTIIHEMIHYYIGIKQLKDTSAHGKIFRKMMKDINERYGRHITISYRSKATTLPRRKVVRKEPTDILHILKNYIGTFPF